ncbi:MAG: hypothetical protein ACRD2E_06255 [Terriglobales bacterium]
MIVAYAVFAVILVLGAGLIFARGEWRQSRGWERLILFGPVFYAAPIAAFGTEHFTTTRDIAALVPGWLPWHVFWAYVVGACFIGAGLSLATKVAARWAASLLALTFFLFVLLMDLPGWAQDLHSRFAAALALRELAFCAGALALAASLGAMGRGRRGRAAATVARYFIGIGVVFYCVEQFLHSHHVPGIPLEAMTPAWIFGHAVWTYLAAVVYAGGGALLLAGKRTRAAATAVAAVALFVVLVVYVPMAVAEHTSLTGINYAADTLMYCGTVLMLAGAMPGAASRESPITAPAKTLAGEAPAAG